MKAKSVVGINLGILVLANLALWWYFSFQSANFEETKAAYLSLFPEGLRNAQLLTVISIGMSTISIYLIESSTDKGSRLHRLLAQPTVYLDVVMICWLAFSLL